MPQSASPPPVTGRSEAEEGHIALAPALTSDQAAPLLEALRAASSDTIVLDARGVERIGGLCLQILLSASRSFAGTGRRLVMAAPSAACLDALALMGAQDLIAMDPAP